MYSLISKTSDSVVIVWKKASENVFHKLDIY